MCAHCPRGGPLWPVATGHHICHAGRTSKPPACPDPSPCTSLSSLWLASQVGDRWVTGHMVVGSRGGVGYLTRIQVQSPFKAYPMHHIIDRLRMPLMVPAFLHIILDTLCSVLCSHWAVSISIVQGSHCCTSLVMCSSLACTVLTDKPPPIRSESKLQVYTFGQ